MMEEKKPLLLCMVKAAETLEGGEIEIWDNGKNQSFLFIDECVEVAR